MISDLSIYVNSTGEFTRLDLFDDETIEVVDSIQNARDPGKFFSVYTKEFTVPASAVNNRVFGHYYNSDITDAGTVTGPFDGRQRYDAQIRFSGLLFREGQIKLQSVQLRGHTPHAYTIVFYGATSKIKEELSDANLNALSDLTKYDHTYSGSVVKDGFEVGLSESAGVLSRAANVAAADVIYPFISHTGQYILDSSVTGNIYRLNEDDPTDTTVQLRYQDLKAAIRVYDVILAMESQFGITFDKTGFFADTQFTEQLWLWLHRTKGDVVGIDDNTSYFYFPQSTYNSGGTSDRDITGGNNYFTIDDWGTGLDLTFSTTITGAGSYDVRVFNAYNGGTVYQETGLVGNDSFSEIIFKGQGHDKFAPVVEIISAGTITQIDLTLEAQEWPNGDIGNYDWAAITPNKEFTVLANIPDMSCLDFLVNIFRMFNLTIERRGDVYYIETLDDFYSGGATWDLTRYIDVSDVTIMPPTPFDKISFKFAGTETFLNNKRTELLGETYGNEEYRIGTLFEDNEYDLEVGFEKLLFERMTDIDTDTLDTWIWAWCADSDGDPFLGKPVIFHLDEDIPSTPTNAITWEHAAVSSTTGLFCSNTVNDGVDWTLTFGKEIGEYTLQSETGNLFTEYWQNYIEGVYNTGNRMVKVRAVLPQTFISQYSLADTIIYRNKAYFINEISINLMTGEASIELLNKWL